MIVYIKVEKKIFLSSPLHREGKEWSKYVAWYSQGLNLKTYSIF